MPFRLQINFLMSLRAASRRGQCVRLVAMTDPAPTVMICSGDHLMVHRAPSMTASRDVIVVDAGDDPSSLPRLGCEMSEV
jgi:hypothetical protein